MKVDPENIFLSSFIPLIQLPSENWFLDFKIIYENQMGDDIGGLMKDWLTKLSDAMFNPDSELFQCLEDNENYIIMQKKDEELNDVTNLMYRFAGMIIARALIQGELITAQLTRSLLKLILHHEVKLSDVEDLDQNIYNSPMYIKENNIGDGKDLNIAFEETMSTGETVELKENGGEIIVNEENKEEYLSLKTDFLLRDSFLKQAEHFCGGFDSLIDHRLPDHIELLDNFD